MSAVRELLETYVSQNNLGYYLLKHMIATDRHHLTQVNIFSCITSKIRFISLLITFE
jgi:hypothetical protein